MHLQQLKSHAGMMRDFFRGKSGYNRDSALLALALLAGLAIASSSFGLCWDESIYVEFSEGLRAWARAGFPLGASALETAWHWKPFFNPHPPFLRALSALGAALVGGAFPLNYRWGNLAIAAGGLAASFRLLAPRFGKGSALAAVAFVLLQPRLLAELLIATQDGPVAIGWLLAAILSWRIAEGERSAWPAYFATQALLTCVKITGFLALAPALALHAWRRDARAFGLTVSAGLFSLAALALTSPSGWHAPLATIQGYLAYPFERGQAVSVATIYLGRIYGEHLPWHAFFALTAITVPALTLVGATLAPLASRSPAHRGLLRALAPFALAWVAIGALPFTPKHDGVRQFVAFFPLLGLLAWLGYASLPWRAARILALLAAAVATVGAHPFEQSYYNAFVGGLPGAAAAGFEVTYDFAALGARDLAWMNANLPLGASLAMRPGWQPLLLRYQREGLLRADFRMPVENGAPADFLLLFRRRSLVPDEQFSAGATLFERAWNGFSVLRLAKP